MQNKEESTPLVSVIMSTYNNAVFIKDAVESILKQTYSNLEFIIIDDASMDNTYEIISNIHDSRLVIKRNSDNKKLPYNLNQAIQLARGKYIARMDGDDIAYPDRIAFQVEFMESHPEVDVCGCLAKCIGDSNHVLKYPETSAEIKSQLVFENAFCHPTVMFRAATMNYFYDEKYPAGQDYELWSRIVWNKSCCNIQKVLLSYRTHKNQTKYANGKQQKIGARAARERMISFLYPNESTEFYELLVQRCSSEFVCSKKELKELEDIYLQMIEKNKQMKVFDFEIFNKTVADHYFEVWYRSMRSGKTELKDIKESVFMDTYNTCSVYLKIKIHVHLLISNILGGVLDDNCNWHLFGRCLVCLSM